MNNPRPYAPDWEVLTKDIHYSEYLKLYWSVSKSRVYDQRSAEHNGIIGAGAQLRKIIKEENQK